MEIAMIISVIITTLSLLTSYLRIKRAKKQISEMKDILVDIKNGNSNRRILSTPNELVAPIT
ncbi:hypothetical protein, partial [Escherichia coli]